MPALSIGNCVLGWASYTQGKPRVIVRSLPDGYLYRYLGENTLFESPRLDPFFNLPAWKIMDTPEQQSDEEKQAVIIAEQSAKIIELTEENKRLKLQLEVLQAETVDG